MQILTSIYGGVEAICGFTTTGHGSASDLRMPWNVAKQLKPGGREVPI
jgi:hypothetical protein